LRNKVSASEYLAFLSMKYEVDPDKFFYALVSAGENQESTCGDLSIKCRGKPQDKVVLLITKGSKVVAQFPVSTEFLMDRGNPLRSLRRTNVLRRHPVKESNEKRFFHIKDLRTGMKKVNLKAKVLEISEPVFVVTRFGNHAKVANALINDETGTIRLCLWNEQVNLVSVGDIVQIENASVSTFRGGRQLRIGKKGKLSEVEDVDCRSTV
jgi:replication factor A1